MKFQKHIGLDLGSDTIKAVELAEVSANKYKLTAVASVPTPKVDNQLERQTVFAEVIKKVLKDGHFTSKMVTMSLPESQVDTRVVEMPYLEEPDLTAAIKWQAEQYVSLPLSDVTLRHQVVSVPQTGTPDAKMQVLLVAAPNNYIADLMSIASKAGLEPVGIETESFAVARSLVAFENESTAPTSLLIHLGATSTTLTILRQGDFVFSQTSATGGLAMTRALSSELGLEFAQADEYKKTYGLEPDKIDGKVRSVLKPLVDLLASEIQKSLVYFDSHRLGESNGIKRIVLSGGAAQLPGLVLYLTEKFNQEIQIGNPFQFISLEQNQKVVLAEHESGFATAVGLALKQT